MPRRSGLPYCSYSQLAGFPDLEAEAKLSLPGGISALIGRNGTGKTRLIRLLLGQEDWPEATVKRNGAMGYLPQTSVPPEGVSIREHLGVADILTAFHALESGSGSEQDLEVLADRWSIVSDVETALARLGLSDIDLTRPVSSLSGGEFTRSELARLELSKVDFLILDEPTNHLDLEAKTYVHQFLKEWKGGALVASHDRDILRSADRILELTSNGLSTYSGNYDDFVRHKAFEAEAADRAVESAKKRVSHIKKEAQRSTERAASRAQTGKKLRREGSLPKSTLDAMKRAAENSMGTRARNAERSLDSASEDLKDAEARRERFRTLSFDLPSSGAKSGQTLLRIEEAGFAYGKRDPVLFRDLSLLIRGGDKVAVAGPNGSGKSTLLKLIGDGLEVGVKTGRIAVPAKRMAYLDQKTALIEGYENIMEAFLALNPKSNAGEAHAALAKFLFRNDDAFKRIEHLSGGERLRACLAILLFSSQPPDLLLLDEPNNHLDLDSQLAVASALRAYDGGLLIVSHDRDFLCDVTMTHQLSLSTSSGVPILDTTEGEA